VDVIVPAGNGRLISWGPRKVGDSKFVGGACGGLVKMVLRVAGIEIFFVRKLLCRNNFLVLFLLMFDRNSCFCFWVTLVLPPLFRIGSLVALAALVALIRRRGPRLFFFFGGKAQ
jgi:hypothetical protein